MGIPTRRDKLFSVRKKLWSWLVQIVIFAAWTSIVFYLDIKLSDKDGIVILSSTAIAILNLLALMSWYILVQISTEIEQAKAEKLTN